MIAGGNHTLISREVTNIIAPITHDQRALPARIWKKRKAEAFRCISAFALLSLNSQDLTAIVGTASLASSVGHNGLAALGANRYAGSRQLPVGATALIAAGLGHFTLRDSHGDTSLVKLLLTA